MFSIFFTNAFLYPRYDSLCLCKKNVKKYFRLPFITKNTVRGYTYDAGYTYGAHCIYFAHSHNALHPVK